MSFLFPLGMAALGALAPLVVLYLLKQKRVEEKVPANFLWARAMEDLRASSLFQRFRAPLLFLLQSLAIVICALAAAGASLNLDVGHAPRRVVLLVDRSASMQAVDATVDGSPASRFAAAKDLARTLVDGLSRSDELMIVAFDARAEVIQSFTPDTDRLREALDSLEPRDLTSHVADALEIATSFARASRGFDPEIVILSDGCVEEGLPATSFPVRFAKVGTASANQGVTAVTVTRTPGETAQVLARVENADTVGATRNVVLQRGTEVVDARQIDLEPGGDATVMFDLKDADDAKSEGWSVALDGSDSLAADDRVPFIARPAVDRFGLVVRREASLHLDPTRLARLRPGLVVAGVTPEEAAATLAAGTTQVDFICYDGVAPETLPSVPAQMYVNCVPPGSGLVVTGTQENPIVIDWSRTHPSTSRCQFDDVFITEALKLTGTERSLGLVETTGGPLVLLAPVPGREVIVVAFDPAHSNLPLKLAWPLFMANSMDFLLSGTSRAGEEPVVRTGTIVQLDAAFGPWKVATPAGGTVEPTPDASGRIAFRDGLRTGIYRATSTASGAVPAKETMHAFALLDSAESRIAPRDQIVVGGTARASDAAGLRRNLLLRDSLLLAVLGLLLLEWAVWAARR
ncbi:MAG: BatA and WFA domain-containing protein [Planctomycetes bacterium]|nr:BatA and WFA domain-containing protein [Planctomycetota bacterium]